MIQRKKKYDSKKDTQYLEEKTTNKCRSMIGFLDDKDNHTNIIV